MRTDAVAIGLSGLCLIHCLALPVMASLVPILGAVAEAEWLHRAFVAFAVPVALFAFTRTAGGTLRLAFGVFAALGCALLIAGAFVEQLHDYEVLLTTLGALTLAAAHLYRWRSHQG